MDELPFFQEIFVIFALATAVLLICHRLRLPTIVGFFLTGLICGPHGFKLVSEVDDVKLLAEIGIIFLLFTIGMEVSVKKILELKRYFLIGGLIQVGLTVCFGYAMGNFMGRPLGESFFLGCLLALSSTAIVLRLLEQRGEMDTPHGRIVLAILIFQDIASIPMMLLIPLLAGTEEIVLDQNFLLSLGKGILVLVGTLFAARLFVPKLMFMIAKTRSRELFLLGVLTICLSVAWLAASAGISLSLGAFLAGLIISESEYSHEAIGDVLPFQDIFTSFFFVSVGMLLNVSFIIENPMIVFGVTSGILVMKFFTGSIATLALGMPLRTRILVAIALCQIGEFSFVLAKVGLDAGLANDYFYQLFLDVSVITMAVSPTLIAVAPWLSEHILRLPIPNKIKTGLSPQPEQENIELKDHVIIVGFGISGRNLAFACRRTETPYRVLEMNPETVKNEKANGEPIVFGDASHEAVLSHIRIKEARAVAVLINDPVAALRIVKLAKRLNPHVYLIVRTRYVQEVRLMYQLGADDVIPDEFGSSLEVFTRVLNTLEVPIHDIQELVNEIRTGGYDLLRLQYKEHAHLDVVLETYRIHEASPLVGQSIGEANLRKKYNITVMLIKRNSESISEINASTKLYANDLLVILGSPKKLQEAAREFHAPRLSTPYSIL